jgi:GNAT superfamily N-acetyltransferase
MLTGWPKCERNSPTRSRMQAKSILGISELQKTLLAASGSRDQREAPGTPERTPNRCVLVIRQILPTEGNQLRAIRLQAIAESPSAFGSTLAETQALSAEDWAKRASRNATGEVAVMFVAEDEGAWVGLAGGMLDPQAKPRSVTLVSMWVNPGYRRRCIGRELVRRVSEWARLRADRIELWVTQNNTAAIALYTTCGFTACTDTKPLPSNSALLEQRMVQDFARCRSSERSN